jgi:hypothetical protein
MIATVDITSLIIEVCTGIVNATLLVHYYYYIIILEDVIYCDILQYLVLTSTFKKNFKIFS